MWSMGSRSIWWTGGCTDGGFGVAVDLPMPTFGGGSLNCSIATKFVANGFVDIAAMPRMSFVIERRGGSPASDRHKIVVQSE